MDVTLTADGVLVFSERLDVRELAEPLDHNAVSLRALEALVDRHHELVAGLVAAGRRVQLRLADPDGGAPTLVIDQAPGSFSYRIEEPSA